MAKTYLFIYVQFANLNARTIFLQDSKTVNAFGEAILRNKLKKKKIPVPPALLKSRPLPTPPPLSKPVCDRRYSKHVFRSQTVRGILTPYRHQLTFRTAMEPLLDSTFYAASAPWLIFQSGGNIGMNAYCALLNANVCKTFCLD